MAGTLDVSLLPGAGYTFGEVFTILTADQITGAFQTLDLPTGWQLQSTSTTISLIALPEPGWPLSLLALAALALTARTSRRRPSSLSCAEPA